MIVAILKIESNDFPLLASQIVWLDALLMNVDRTVRNTNMLWWHKELWLIDHGASLYFHHSWEGWQLSSRPFPYIKDHVLLRRASELAVVHQQFREILSPTIIDSIVSLIPDGWLAESPFDSITDHRKAYAHFLNNRIANSDQFLNEALNARAALI